MIAIRWIVLVFVLALLADYCAITTAQDPRGAFSVREVADLYADLARGAK